MALKGRIQSEQRGVVRARRPVTCATEGEVMSDVTRYMWTATGLRPSEIEHGPVRFIRETDYDALRATVARMTTALRDIRWHAKHGDAYAAETCGKLANDALDSPE